MSDDAPLFIPPYLDEDIHKRVAAALRLRHFDVSSAQEHKEHAGIIASDQLPIGETIRRLLKLLNQVTADEIRNQLYWLQSFQ